MALEPWLIILVVYDVEALHEGFLGGTAEATGL